TPSLSPSGSNHFSSLVSDDNLDIYNPNHIWLLQHLSMDNIITALASWAESQNSHQITQRDGPSRSPEDMWGFEKLAHGVPGDNWTTSPCRIQSWRFFGLDWEPLEDNDLTQTLRGNYAHEEDASTWLGRHGPPPNLNEVQVDPPEGLFGLLKTCSFQ
ncbi:hypothetical protein EV360DRAFT_57925, partial [Lentinula raphanica]